MTFSISDPLEYYAQHGPFTDPREFSALVNILPRQIPKLVKIVQNTLLHVFWAERYGVQHTEEQKATLNVRGAAAKLAHLTASGRLDLTIPCPPEQRQVGNCRDFSLLLCTLLRCQGVPARARCGFGTYFLPGHYEDHWVCEYWNDSQQRWMMVDAQLDEFQSRELAIDFDPLDMPPGKFLTGGQAWQLARSGAADPDQFGIFDMHGLWFIAGNVVRDLLSLNKIEILPWDHGWGLLGGDQAEGETMDDRHACYDKIAALIIPGQEDFPALRALYQTEPRLHPPADYFS